MPAWQLGGTSFVESHLKVLGSLLYSDDVDVREAAGEAVTQLYDSCELATLPESAPKDDEDQEGDGIPERLEDIVSRMQDLAKNRGDETRRSKKDRVTLRGTFRQLCTILEVGRSVHHGLM